MNGLQTFVRARIFLPVAVLLLSGCSIIGAGLGSTLDDPENITTSTEQPSYLSEVAPGDELTLKLFSGKEHSGEFRGIAQPTLDELNTMLETSSRIEGGPLLQRGDAVDVVTEDGESYPVRFIGCDGLGVYLQRSEDRKPLYIILPLLDHLKLAGGETFDADDLQDALANGNLRSVGNVRLESDSASQLIPLDEVESVITTSRRRPGLITGFIVGLAVDAFLIYSMVDTDSSPPPPPEVKKKDTGASSGAGAGGACGCPFVFGRTGDDYIVEGECFSGAVFEAAQRRDWMKLAFTQPEDGALHLQLRDLLQEVDYIDHLALLRVEHAEGSEVVPTEDGRLLECTLTAPRSAVDDEGRDVRSLVTDGTERWWLSHPAGRINGSKPLRAEASPDRPGLTVTFPKPADTDSITLVARLQNTDWGAQLHYGFFGLFGEALPAQYELWNSDQKARADLHQLMLREGMLRVSIQTGDGWQVAGYYWEVGLAAFRSVALPLDISGIEGDALTLRFDAPAGVWMIAEVGIDGASPRTVTPERIPVAAAERHDGGNCTENFRTDTDTESPSGSDCTENLRTEDGRHLILDTGEWADVRFDVPAGEIPTGRHVTWVLESSGYYRMKLDSTQPAQTATLQRIFGESGYFAQFAAELWRRQVSVEMAKTER